jgi:hypothetical protein
MVPVGRTAWVKWPKMESVLDGQDVLSEDGYS